MSKRISRVRRRRGIGKRYSPFFASRRSSGFLGLQAKLSVGQPGDKYEAEADAVADKVVERTNSGSNAFFGTSNSFFTNNNGLVQEKPLAGEITPLVQKQEEEEEELQAKQLGNIQMQVEEEEPVQAQTEDEEEEMAQMQPEEEEEIQAKPMENPAVAPATETRIKSSAGSGNKMDAVTRREMESGFGADFSQVNIHTGSQAVQMNKELGAQAFTHGKDIYFNEGKYNPNSNAGKHLLAHELTHTIQQNKDMVQPFNNGEISAKSGKKGVKTQAADYTRILRKTYDPKENLQSRRFSGNFALELVYDNQSLVFNGLAGETVTIIQSALESFGYPLKDHGVDGIFGNETEKAVRDFQTDNNATMIDGIVGPETMRLLDKQALKGEKNKKEKKEEEIIDETEKTVLEKVEEELEKGSGDKRAEYALCILELYKAYRAHFDIYDKYMGPGVVLHYVENDMGNKWGNTFSPPHKHEKSSTFRRLDRAIKRNAATFTLNLLSESNSILEGINLVGKLNRDKRYRLHYKITLDFLYNYMQKRMQKADDLYSCFK